MEKKYYYVSCTMIHNGTMEVEASSEEEALEIATANLKRDANTTCDWTFGEATADYAELED